MHQPPRASLCPGRSALSHSTSWGKQMESHFVKPGRGLDTSMSKACNPVFNVSFIRAHEGKLRPKKAQKVARDEVAKGD